MKTLLLALALLPAFQETASKVEQEVEYANDPEKLSFQVQAIDRLRKRGADAVPALLAFVEKKGPNALSLGCTELFADIPDPRLADLCARLVENRDFYWRPAAARALAEQKPEKHRDVLRRLVADRLWGVRAAAILGLGLLNDRESAEPIRKALNDETYDVRAQAAKTLHGFGDSSGLPVLVASLRAEAEWFDIDYGQLAREDASKFLAKIAGEDFGYKAWDPADKREPGLKRWEEWIGARMPEWKDRVPANARPVSEAAEYVFGFELRSCRSGDFFFRIDSKNNFVVGYFNLARAPLTAAERADFDRHLEAVRSVERSVPYGQGGCDFEQYYLQAPGGKRFEKLWIGLGGRPASMEGFIRHCHDLIRSKFGASEAAEFKERTGPFRSAN